MGLASKYDRKRVLLGFSVCLNVFLAIAVLHLNEAEEFHEEPTVEGELSQQSSRKQSGLIRDQEKANIRKSYTSSSEKMVFFDRYGVDPVPSRRCKDWLRGSHFLWAASTPGTGTDKASNTHGKHAYEVLYEKYFQLFYCTAEYALKPKIKLFEIGIGPGGFMTSFRMYERLFGEDRLEYYALEYQDQRKIIADHHELTERQKRIALGRLRIGDQSNIRDLENITVEWAPFDVIVDDGSHVTWHQIKSFKYLFLNSLAPGGVYFIEDLQTNFHRKWNGSKKDQLRAHTAVEMINDFIQFLHFHWWAHPEFSAKHILSGDISERHREKEENPYGQEIFQFTHYEPEILDWISTIDCDREVCAIRKRMSRLEHRNYAQNVRM